MPRPIRLKRLFRRPVIVRGKPRPRGGGKRFNKTHGALIKLIIILVVVGLISMLVGRYLTHLSSKFAVATVRDSVMIAVNESIADSMAEGGYGYDYFVSLEKDETGNISALTTNMSRVNALSSQLIRDIIIASNTGSFDISIPIGNLMGFNLTSGRGPRVPVRIVMLTSSTAEFRNEFTDAGINQTKHEIYLDISIDVEVLIPWDSVNTNINSEILIAETVIVGRVPDTYLMWGE